MNLDNTIARLRRELAAESAAHEATVADLVAVSWERDQLREAPSGKYFRMIQQAAGRPGVSSWKDLAEYVGELAAARAALENLPDRFSHSVFVCAGMTLEQSSTALMVSRRVLEDAETERYEAARAATAEPKEPNANT